MLLIDAIWGKWCSHSKTFWKLCLPSIAILSEVAQALSLLPGTFDPLDLAALAAAVLLAWFVPCKVMTCDTAALPHLGRSKKILSGCLTAVVALLVVGSEQRSSRTQNTQGDGSGEQNQGSTASQGQGTQGIAQQQGQGSQGTQGQDDQGQSGSPSSGQSSSQGQSSPHSSTQQQGQGAESAAQGQTDGTSSDNPTAQADSSAANSSGAASGGGNPQGQAREDSPSQQAQATQSQGAQNSGLQGAASAPPQQYPQLKPVPGQSAGPNASAVQGPSGVPGNSTGSGGSSPFATNGTRGVPRIDPVSGGYVVTPNSDTAPPAAEPQQGPQQQPQNFPEFR
jgi:hypothetical protein